MLWPRFFSQIVIGGADALERGVGWVKVQCLDDLTDGFTHRPLFLHETTDHPGRVDPRAVRGPSCWGQRSASLNLPNCFFDIHFGYVEYLYK